MGPFSPAALGEFRYVRMIPDQYTKWNDVYLIKSKEDAVDTVKCFVQWIVFSLRRSVEGIRTDRGGKYTAGCFKKHCFDTGVRHEFASTATP